MGRSRTKSLPQLGMPKDMQKKSTTVAHSDEALSARDQDLESGLVKSNVFVANDGFVPRATFRFPFGTFVFRRNTKVEDEQPAGSAKEFSCL